MYGYLKGIEIQAFLLTIKSFIFISIKFEKKKVNLYYFLFICFKKLKDYLI